MKRSSTTVVSQKGLIVLAQVVIGAVAVCALYFGKPILLPLALAIFLTLILTPLVSALQRRKVNRTLSIVIVIVTVGIVASGVVILVSSQFISLVNELPAHTENIKAKVRSLQELGKGTVIDRLDVMWNEISAEWNRKSANKTSIAPVPVPPVDGDAPPVVVQPAQPSWTERLPNLLQPALGGAFALGLAWVLAFFILLRREVLRNRIIYFVGGSLIVTTKALDDAGDRISYYLRMQLIINATYGLVWGTGLFFIGVDYAVLWGFLAAVLRFVPYVGPWLSALMPLTLTVAQFPGWSQVIMVLSLLLVLELVSNNIMEPMLYGRSTGVSEVAMLISATFWTLIWGPIGLVISGPITVCLAVVGKYFPPLKFFDMLLGDDAVLEPHLSYYQRLIARDVDEAVRLVLRERKSKSLEQTFDEVLIPALNLIKYDRVRSDVTGADEEFVVDTTRKILADLDGLEEAPETPADVSEPQTEKPVAVLVDALPRISLMGYPAYDGEDQVALDMLACLLDQQDWDVHIETTDALAAEWLERVAEQRPGLVCIAALPPGGMAHARYICKKLRTRFPDMKILVGRWGLKSGIETNREEFVAAGADQMATTLQETCNQLQSWLPVLADLQTREMADKRPWDVRPSVVSALGGNERNSAFNHDEERDSS